jgi:hypothetical protein
MCEKPHFLGIILQTLSNQQIKPKNSTNQTNKLNFIKPTNQTNKSNFVKPTNQTLSNQ